MVKSDNLTMVDGALGEAVLFLAMEIGAEKNVRRDICKSIAMIRSVT